MTYTIFIKDSCSRCKMAQNILNSKGIKFKTVDVGTQEGFNLAKSLNITSAGTIIDNNNNIIDISSI